MNSLILSLREKREIRDAECSRLETEQSVEHESRELELEKLKEDRLQCEETIVNNVNGITSHRHTISKVLHQSEQCVGLPISNKYHGQAVEVVSETIKLIGNKKIFKLDNSINLERLNDEVQHCTQSVADNFKGMKSSAERVETLMHSVHIIGRQCDDREVDLESSIFDN